MTTTIKEARATTTTTPTPSLTHFRTRSLFCALLNLATLKLAVTGRNLRYSPLLAWKERRMCDRKRRERRPRRERVSNFSTCVVIVALVVYLVVARSCRCCDCVSLRRLKDEKQRKVFRKNYSPSIGKIFLDSTVHRIAGIICVPLKMEFL